MTSMWKKKNSKGILNTFQDLVFDQNYEAINGGRSNGVKARAMESPST